jgi:hypothetical protein
MKKKSIIEFLIVLTVGVGSTLIFINQRKASYKAKIESGDFAIGTFIQFGVNLVGYSHYYKYYYRNKYGKKVFYVDSGRMPDDKLKNEIKKGNQFFVIYNNDGASIFFDKPIKDSIDFKRYVKEFEEMRKQKAKE